MKDKTKQIQGKRNKQRGTIWESKVKKDLELKGWNVTKFQSNVQLPEWDESIQKSLENAIKTSYEAEQEFWDKYRKHYPGRLIPAKRKFNPFSRAMMLSSGFPDFLCWKLGDMADLEIEEFNTYISSCYGVIVVEAKSNGFLDKEEKEKCRWLLKNQIFNTILIAKKKEEGRKIIPEYINFGEKYMGTKDDKKEII